MRDDDCMPRRSFWTQHGSMEVALGRCASEELALGTVQSGNATRKRLPVTKRTGLSR